MRIFAFCFSSIVACPLTINIPQAGAGSVYDAMIAAQAEANGVPVSLIHRVIMRESRYNPRAVRKLWADADPAQHGTSYGLSRLSRGPARSSNQFDVCGSILGRCLSCRSWQRKPRCGAIRTRVLWGGEEARFLAIRFFLNNPQ